MLSLPSNFIQYNSYIQKGINQNLENFDEVFPLKSGKLASKMIRVMSVLSNISPVLSDLQIVPGMVFPFVKLFSKDECLGMEMALSFFMHWGQHLFEDYPQPSARAVSFVSLLSKSLRKTLFDILSPF